MMSTRADDLSLTGDINNERSCVSLIALATWRLPAHLAGGGVKGDDELRVEAIAADDEQILKKALETRRGHAEARTSASACTVRRP